MSRPRLLDLCCGPGGAARGYQQAGFHVTGVDKYDQPAYCGDVFIKADALEMLADTGFLAGFDAIHGSFPCQVFARVTAWRGSRGDHEDLLTPALPLLAAQPLPWVVENVPEASPPLRTDLVLCGSQFGLRVRRHRAFQMSFPAPFILTPCWHGRGRLLVFEHKGERAYADAMGCTWMSNKAARQAIPPAYTEFVGEHLLDHLAMQATP